MLPARSSTPSDAHRTAPDPSAHTGTIRAPGPSLLINSENVFRSLSPESTQVGVNPDLYSLIRRQHGVVTRTQCLDLGLSRHQIAHQLDIGSIEPMLAGVYRHAASLPSLDQRATAAALAGGPAALVSHRMALAVWGMRNYRCDLMEITTRSHVARPELVAHRSRVALETAVVRGIPVTSRRQTMLDCAALTSTAVMGRFLEVWLSGGVLKLDDVETVLDERSRHRGASTLRDALAGRSIAGTVPDSPAEGLLGPLLVRHGLPMPELHHLVTVSNGNMFELDWTYVRPKVAFEIDGYGVHLRSFNAFENDRLRRNELEIDGWRIMNFTRNLVVNRPARVVDQVRRMLAERGSAQI